MDENKKISRYYNEIRDETRKIKCLTQQAEILLKDQDSLFDIEVILLKAKWLAEAYKRDEQISEVHEGLGDYFQRLGNTREAMMNFEKAKKIKRKMGYKDDSGDIKRLDNKINGTRC